MNNHTIFLVQGVNGTGRFLKILKQNLFKFLINLRLSLEGKLKVYGLMTCLPNSGMTQSLDTDHVIHHLFD